MDRHGFGASSDIDSLVSTIRSEQYQNACAEWHKLHASRAQKSHVPPTGRIMSDLKRRRQLFIETLDAPDFLSLAQKSGVRSEGISIYYLAREKLQRERHKRTGQALESEDDIDSYFDPLTYI